jgi:hypothetical protein
VTKKYSFNCKILLVMSVNHSALSRRFLEKIPRFIKINESKNKAHGNMNDYSTT